MGMTLTTAPITSPVSIEEARAQCSIYENDASFDTLLQIYINAAVSHLDGYFGILQRALEPQGWTMTLDSFANGITIPFGPVIQITSIKYNDTEGDEQTIDAENYALDTSDDQIRVFPVSGYSWPSTQAGVNQVSVEFDAGYEGETDSNGYQTGIPTAIKQALLLLIGHWFMNREAVSVGAAVNEMPLAVESLLRPYKRTIFA